MRYLALICCQLFLAWPLLAAMPQVTEPIMLNGRLVALKTDNANLIYIIPQSYRIYEDNVVLEYSEESSSYFLSFIVGPDYEEGLPLYAQLKNQNPSLFLFEVPKNIERSFLQVPSELGVVESSLTLDNSLNRSSLIYYRIKLNDKELNYLRTITVGKTQLLGMVGMRFLTNAGETSRNIPLYLDLTQSDLLIKEKDQVYSKVWLKELVFNNEFLLKNVIDQTYSLGFGVSINIADSIFRGRLIKDASEFMAEGHQAVVRNIDSHNFWGRLNFSIPELEQDYQLDCRFAIDIALSLQDLNVNITRLNLVDISAEGSALNSFMEMALTKLLANPGVMSLLSQALTTELRRRVLNNNLVVIP